MSQENVEVVSQIYSAMNARDVDAITELAHPDAEWIPDSRVGQGPIRGRENIIRFFMEQAETFEEFRLEPERPCAFSGIDGHPTNGVDGKALRARTRTRRAVAWSVWAGCDQCC